MTRAGLFVRLAVAALPLILIVGCAKDRTDKTPTAEAVGSDPAEMGPLIDTSPDDPAQLDEQAQLAAQRPADGRSADPLQEQISVDLAQLAELPAEVRDAFRRQYPDARVTDVKRLNVGSGQALYEVVFLQNDQPYDITYRADGSAVTKTPLTGQ